MRRPPGDLPDPRCSRTGGTPATFTVNTTLDADDGSPFDPAGTTSLRKAVRLANIDQVPDTITFAPELADGTIGLTGGQLDNHPAGEHRRAGRQGDHRRQRPGPHLQRRRPD